MFAYSFALVERAKAELARLKTDRKGVTALEYGILASVLVVTLFLAFGKVTSALSNFFGTIAGKLTTG